MDTECSQREPIGCIWSTYRGVLQYERAKSSVPTIFGDDTDGAASCLVSAGALACPECGRSYFLPRAGRSLDGENLQLEPIPLLQEQGRIRVALAL